MTDFEEKRALATFNHSNQLERQRLARQDRDRLEFRRQQAQTDAAAIAATGNLEAMRLAHELDAETRERNFLDLVREENVRLQALIQETKIAQIDRTHESQTQINQMTQEAIIDLVKKVLAKRLGITEQDLEAAKFIKQERAKHQLEREFEADLAEKISAVMQKLKKMQT